jgi:hypothetical protein
MDTYPRNFKTDNFSLLLAFPSLLIHCPWNYLQLHQQNLSFFILLLGEITLDTTMTSVAASAFQSCSGLTGVLIIPSSITTIGANAFNGCHGFTGSLIIPSSVTTIGPSGFMVALVSLAP